MGEPARAHFLFDAEGSAEWVSDQRVDMADLLQSVMVGAASRRRTTFVPPILQRLVAIKKNLDGCERTARALTPDPVASSAGHHGTSARDKG